MGVTKHVNEVVTIIVIVFCLKLKMLNKEFGGSVMKKDIREDGVFKINVETSSLIFRYGWYTYTVVEYFVTQC